MTAVIQSALGSAAFLASLERIVIGSRPCPYPCIGRSRGLRQAKTGQFDCYDRVAFGEFRHEAVPLIPCLSEAVD